MNQLIKATSENFPFDLQTIEPLQNFVYAKKLAIQNNTHSFSGFASGQYYHER